MPADGGALVQHAAERGAEHALVDERDPPGLPFGVLFGEQTLAADEASSWDAFWAAQRGPKLQLSLLRSEHATFTDFAPLVPQAALILGEPPSWVTKLIGTISGPRAVTVERTYIRAWFDMYLGHRDSRLLAGPSPLFPEVRFVR